MNETRTGVGLIEILVAAAILGCTLVPVVALVSSGRRTTEFNGRRLQAVLICQRLLGVIAEESRGSLNSLTDEARQQAMAERVLETIDEAQRKNFALSLTVAPAADSEHLYEVGATVEFRLSPAHQNWHRVELHTMVARRTPF